MAQKRWHQNISIDGVDLPAEYANRKGSRFFNEGKWRTFIEPLLPPDPQERTFVEIGCNVGLFLRLATEYGFGRVVGVEADADNCAMAEQYRDARGLGYRVLHRAVGDDFSFDELPVADVVLLSNVHYYIPMADFMPFLDRLFHKTIYCIVVSRAMQDKNRGYPLPELEPLRLMFRDWQVERVLRTSSRMLKDDPHPRRVYSVRFRSRLERQPISDYTTRGQRYEKQQEFIDIIKAGQDVKLEDTLNWRYWQQRKSGRWSDAQIRAHVQHRYDLVRDIMENGVREPVLAWPDRVGIDGGNRAQILKLLGYNSLIVRVI